MCDRIAWQAVVATVRTLDDIHAGLLPEDKLRHLREFSGTGEPGDKVLMVGDGESVRLGQPVVAGATVKATVWGGASWAGSVEADAGLRSDPGVS